MSYLKNWRPDLRIRQSKIAIMLETGFLSALAGYFWIMGYWTAAQSGIYLALAMLAGVSALKLSSRFATRCVNLRAVSDAWELSEEGEKASQYILARISVWPFLVVLRFVPVNAKGPGKLVFAKSVLVFPDSVEPVEFRRLKVYLRFRGLSGLSRN